MPAGGYGAAPAAQGGMMPGYGGQYPQFYPGAAAQPGYPYGAYGTYQQGAAQPGQPQPPSSQASDKN